MKCIVKFVPDNKRVTVEAGTDLLTAANKAGISVKSSCGGEGVCGRCRVKVISGNFEVNDKKISNLSADLKAQGYTLACLTKVLSNIEVEIPEESRLDEHQVLLEEKSSELLIEKKLDLLKERNLLPLSNKYILNLPPPTLTENTSDFVKLKAELSKKYGIEDCDIPINQLQNLADLLRESNWEVTTTLSKRQDSNLIVKVEGGIAKKPAYGIAVDIGTTTVAISLIDMKNGISVDKMGTYNKQARFGDDVISRMIYASEKGVKELQQAVIDTINDLITKILKKNNLEYDDISVVTTAGNTTMAHLFLGLNPKYIRLEPYIPTTTQFPVANAHELGLNVNPNAPIYSFPAVASYVGGDIVSGCLAVEITKKDELTLFIDIGTNGEIVLGNREWLISCACSAGPAFEGGGITCGTRAMNGAIEKVRIDSVTKEIEISTIGGKKAIGICGSGLIDCISEMHKAEMIDRTGQFVMTETKNIRKGTDGYELVLVPRNFSALDKDIVITENDIKNLIRSKGAVFAGIRSLLKTMEIELDSIQKILIAGGFGNYINVNKAIEIGLLPDLPHEKFEFVGNTSLKGAELVLLSEDAFKEANEIGKMMTYLELSVGNLFMDEFMSALFLPHTDLSLFPSVAR